MIIDLPESFRFTGQKQFDYAEVRDGVLHMYGTISYSKVIHNIVYALKGKDKCYYCGKTLAKDEISLDHMYAQDVGGPTIPNNLIPCCK